MTSRGRSTHVPAPTSALAAPDPFLGLPGAVSVDEARRAALNLLEDAIAARRAATRETERRARAEQSVRESEEYFRRAIEDAPIPVIMHTEDGEVLQVSKVWSALTGDAEPLVDFHAWLGRCCGEQVDAVAERLLEVFREFGRRVQVDLQILTNDGEPRDWTFSSSSPGRLHDGRRYAVGMALDVTERSRAETALRHSEAQLLKARNALELRVVERTSELAAMNAALATELAERNLANAQIRSLVQRLVDIQEEERRSIARDIHDQLGQQLTALRLSVQLLMVSQKVSGSGLREAERAMRISAELDRTVDALTWQLRPPTTDHLPLTAALSQLVDGWIGHPAIDVRFVEDSVTRLQFSPAVQTHVYRIAQEALHNIHKHARAQRIEMSLERRAQFAVLTIRDDGVGFEPASPSTSRGATLGLVSMRERATLIGASLMVTSEPGAGATISLWLPLELAELDEVVTTDIGAASSVGPAD